MASRLVTVLAFCLAMVVASDADSSPEAYWKAVLGTTVMPNAIKENLPQGHEGKVELPVHLNVRPNGCCAKVKVSVDDDTVASQIFLEKDLHIGNKVDLHFPKSTPATSSFFLPRGVANSIPFSSKKLPQIYSYFAVNPKSDEAEIIKQTLNVCENGHWPGEDTLCATSLESMVDYATSTLGKDVKAYSSVIPNEATGVKKQFTITGVRKLGNERSVVGCHKTSYPYSVFYCHAPRPVTPYLVSLAGTDGTEVKAVTLCHGDTGKWDADYSVLQMLKVKPGNTVCHFLGDHHVVWVRN